MTPTSDFELNTEFLGANNRGLDMGFSQWSDNYDWFGGRGGVETRISDIGPKNGRVRSIFSCKDNGGNSSGRVRIGLKAVEKCGVDRISSGGGSREREEKKAEKRNKRKHGWN